MSAIGVHFGYTSACVAIFKDGRADVVANDAGDRVTPTVVGYRDTEQIVGIAAKQGRVRNAASTVVKVKQVLGRSFDDPEIQRHRTETKCQVGLNNESKPSERPRVRKTAQSALGGSDVSDAVITVPSEFAHAQKRALRNAAEAAGFNVLRLIHEPAAALLAYDIGQESPSGKRCVLGKERLRFHYGHWFKTDVVGVVVLCGGSARIPRLQQMIREMFPDVELLNSAPPDEVIAVGAALEAGLLVGRDGLTPEEDSVTVDVSSIDVLVKETDESGAEMFTLLLPVGTPLPAHRHHILRGDGKLSSLCLEIYQRFITEQPEKLSKIVFRDLQPTDESHSVDTVVTMKSDGSIHLSCVEQGTGRSEVVTIAAS
ncbi:heat shock 70 kDa protein 14 [Neolamprologus brichardi]|uniref:heat shock 70 kDa protein 14 n=1 Tax=Neolamprologus brichardi TaxID=32507 RepID=UPI001643A41A|nr:heat shock 70 kDa protein 14 [Neolamprologus brichardi]